MTSLLDVDDLQTKVSKVQQSFRSHNPNSDPWLRPNNFWITSTVLGGALWELEGRIPGLIDAAMPDTATGEILERWGSLFGVYRRYETYTTGTVTATGTDGAVIASGTKLQRSDGQKYETTAAATISGDEVILNIKAITHGSGGSNASGGYLSFTSTIAGVNKQVTIVENVAGLDKECDDDLRARIIERINRPTRTGTLDDYVAWAKEVAGVTRAWAYVTGLSVSVLFMMDNSYVDGIPQSSDVSTVDDYLNESCRKPVGVVVKACAPTSEILNLNVGCAEPSTIATTELISTEINEYVKNNAIPNGSFSSQDFVSVLNGIPDVTNYTIAEGQTFTPSQGAIFTSANITYGY